MHYRFLLAALSLFAFAACDEDMTDEKATWASATASWAPKLEKIRKGHADVVARVKAFQLPEQAAALAAEKTGLDKATERGGASLAEAEKAMANAKTEIEGLIAKGKKLPLEVALGNTVKSVDGVLAKADSHVSSTLENLELLSKKAAAMKASAELAAARAAKWTAETKNKGGTIVVDDLMWNGEVLDANASKTTLATLAGALKSCAALKVDMVVSGAEEVAPKRAEALKAALVAGGVPATAFGKVEGAAGEATEVNVVVATPCK